MQYGPTDWNQNPILVVVHGPQKVVVKLEGQLHMEEQRM